MYTVYTFELPTTFMCLLKSNSSSAITMFPSTDNNCDHLDVCTCLYLPASYIVMNQGSKVPLVLIMVEHLSIEHWSSQVQIPPELA